MGSAAERAKIVSPGETYVGQQGFTYQAGVSRRTVGDTDVCMNVLPMPPGCESEIALPQGHRYDCLPVGGPLLGLLRDRLEHQAELVAGQQMFMPRDVPHAPVNDSGAPCTWIVVHSSGDDQDDIVMTPELDALLPST